MSTLFCNNEWELKVLSGFSNDNGTNGKISTT